MTKTKRRKKPAPPPPQHWDASTPEQRAHRVYRVTERGDVDPQTGKVVNPNNVTGVEFLTPVEIYCAQGHLEERHLDAAWEYERLARAMRGSPAQRSCLDHSPIGYDDPEPDPRDVEAWNRLMRALGTFERAELDRTVYAHEPTARLSLLRVALTKAADAAGC